ncbi:MAG: S8 family serine peptidase, partial [Halioglobus sp.]
MRKHTRILLAGFSLALCVSACGGGGGSGDGEAIAPPPPPPPTPPPPVGQTFTLSGTISAPASQTVDSDTNDPARTAIDNNSPATAQPMPNPVTVGGYVNLPGTGAPGRFDVSGDSDDFYRVELLAGQRVTMLVADFDAADADLYLLDIDGNVVDFSIDTGEFESVFVETSGTYFVNANAFAGATNYLLAIGTAQSPALVEAARSARSQRDVLPFQAVVRYHAGSEKNAAHNLRALEQNMGMQQRAGGVGRERLMALNPARVSSLQVSTQPGNRDRFASAALQARWETLLAIKTLRDEPGVMYAEPNYRVRPLRAPNDAAFPLQWHYPLISLPEAWDTTTANPGVVVAVIDTGILAQHPDLSGQFVPGYDFVRDAENARDGDGIDSDPSDPGASIGGSSNSFHGTHVSGTIVARGDNGIGIAGVAYDARVMPLRALGEDGGTTYDVDQSLRFAAGL